MLASEKQTKELVELFRSGTKLTYKKGEFIIRPNEAPSGVFYIEEGLVKAYDITKYGEENLLIIRKPREIFPLIRGITGEGRGIMYETLAPTTVWRIPQEKYSKAVRQNAEIIPPLLDLAIEMYQLHSERILNLEYRSVRERLISFLLTMSGRFGKKTSKGLLIDVPLKHQDIASSINASRETTNRELSRLEQKKLLTTRQSKIVLLNVKELRAFL
jgi:CRP/FNR family transcriptional regulator